MTLLDMKLQMQEFDELFINECKKRGMSEQETKREILDNPTRKAMVNAISLSVSLSTKIFPIDINSTQ